MSLNTPCGCPGGGGECRACSVLPVHAGSVQGPSDLATAHVRRPHSKHYEMGPLGCPTTDFIPLRSVRLGAGPPGVCAECLKGAALAPNITRWAPSASQPLFLLSVACLVDTSSIRYSTGYAPHREHQQYSSATRVKQILSSQ